MDESKKLGKFTKSQFENKLDENFANTIFFLVWWILDVKESKLLKTAYVTCLEELIGGNVKQSYM